MEATPDTLILQALSLYRLTRDPLVLSAISVLENERHPEYDSATQFITNLAEAHHILYGRPLD